MILSLASEQKQVLVNHLIEFEEPMNKPAHEPTFKSTNELLIDMWQCLMEINKNEFKEETSVEKTSISRC